MDLDVQDVLYTIFSTDDKVRLVLNFTELHTLTLATRSYALSLHVFGSMTAYLTPLSRDSDTVLASHVSDTALLCNYDVE